MQLYTALFGSRANSISFQAMTIFAATVLIAVSAKIDVPFYPVPMTMQTAAIVGFSAVFGLKRSILMISLYLFEGAIGLPVFSGTPERGIGIAYMVGPTGGYLVGFIFAAALSGYLADRGWTESFMSSFAAAVFSTIIIFAPGVVWLGILFGFTENILETGFYPFIWGGLFKCFLVALSLKVIRIFIDTRQRP